MPDDITLERSGDDLLTGSLSDPLGLATADGHGAPRIAQSVNMKVPVTLATGSSGSPSWARPRTKPTLLVTP